MGFQYVEFENFWESLYDNHPTLDISWYPKVWIGWPLCQEYIIREIDEMLIQCLEFYPWASWILMMKPLLSCNSFFLFLLMLLLYGSHYSNLFSRGFVNSWSKTTIDCCWISLAEWKWWMGPKAWRTLLIYKEYVLFGCLCSWRKVSWLILCCSSWKTSWET